VPDHVTTFWWGVEACLDEDSTFALLKVLDAGGALSSVAGVFAPDPKSKVAVTLAGAALKLGAVVIKAIDRDGGNHGVCIRQFWVGPPCWVKPRAPR
jgi:hypothetical protein